MTSPPFLNFDPTLPASSALPAAVATSPTRTDAETYARQLESEIGHLSAQLMRMFEEMTLIHDLGCNLAMAGDRTTHCRNALDKLAPCLPADTLAIVLVPDACRSTGDPMAAESAEVVQIGQPLDEALICRVAEELGSDEAIVVNCPLGSAPELERVASVRLATGPGNSSRLLAIADRNSGELGTVEVQLMRSVASILQAHLAVDRQFAEMRSMFAGTVLALVSAIDAKDPYTCGHSSRVAQLAQALTRELGYDDETVETVRMAGLLHDIGKIGVPDAILGKPGKLTEEEFAEMRKHPELGYRILRGIRQFEGILPGIRHHHESWDGSGYPSGLAGEEIPEVARILAVADAFDAMTSDRPYRAGMSLEVVESIFRKGRGQQWAADVVDCLLDDRKRLEQMIQDREQERTGQIPSCDPRSNHRISN